MGSARFEVLDFETGPQAFGLRVVKALAASAVRELGLGIA